jgi:hypothetical protein
MSADDATTDTLARDADPTTNSKGALRRTQTSSPTRQTAAYWSMQRTMSDIS